MRRLKFLFSGLLFATLLQAQETFHINGIGDKRDGCYAFTNATIVKDAQTTLTNATMVIRDGKIVSVGNGVAIPKDAVVVGMYPEHFDQITANIDYTNQACGSAS